MDRELGQARPGGLNLGQVDRRSDQAVSGQVADALRRAIIEGRLGFGDKLPPESALIKHYGISRTTARSAIRVLRDEALVEPQQGRGTFVCVRRAKLPRDRWVGASPGLNVTPGGKALEALDQIRELAQRYDLVLRVQIEEIIATVNL